MTMTKFSRINKQREEITMRVLEDMEKGGNEWKKPWVEASPFPPHNPVSGTQYSGRNFLYTYVYGMQRSGARARIKGEVFLPVFTEHAEEKVAERCADTLDGQAQERHRMPMPRIGPVPDPRGNFPFSKKAGAD